MICMLSCAAREVPTYEYRLLPLRQRETLLHPWCYIICLVVVSLPTKMPSTGGVSLPSPEQMAQWPAPNYIDPHTRTVPLRIFAGLGLGIMLPFFIFRLYSNLRLKHGIRIDDWISIGAAVRIRFVPLSTEAAPCK